MVSNDSKSPNSARNAIKKCRRKMAVFGGSGGSAAVFSVFRVGTFYSKNFEEKIRSFSSKMRLNGLKMSNFGGKWRFSAEVAVQPPFFSKIAGR